MTVKEYLTGLEKTSSKFKSASGKSLYDAMIEQTCVWSNYACKGYALMAMKKAGLNEEQIQDVLKEMSYCFDGTSISEAEKIYHEY